MSKHAVIKIVLIGTEGQLDRPEEDYEVRHLEDQAENAKSKILALVGKYPNFGWSLLRADKELTESELADLED